MGIYHCIHVEWPLHHSKWCIPPQGIILIIDPPWVDPWWDHNRTHIHDNANDPRRSGSHKPQALLGSLMDLLFSPSRLACSVLSLQGTK